MKDGKKPEDFSVNKDIIENDDDQFFKDLSVDELEAITGLLEKYVIQIPEEKKIDQTVNTLTHMMRAGKSRKSSRGLVKRLLHITSHVMQYSGKWYVAFCLALYSAALAVTLNDSTINPCAPSLILGPVPFLLAVAGSFRSSRAHMAELEMSFKYTLKQLMTAKLLLAAVFNTVCNTLVSLVLSGANPELDPVRLAFIWCAPFMFVSSVSLFIVIKIRGYYVSLGCLGLWSAISILTVFNPGWLEFLALFVKTELYVIITAVSFLILVYDITALLTKTIERGDFFDTHSEKSVKAI